jgi:2-keto-4-pentenoate hydratase/2-oxohepta-3-ene-1,7-dioic acid hydratase in catechol pathway
MKFVRFEYRGKTGFGVLEGNDVVRVYEGDMFEGARPTRETMALDSVGLLPPCQPSKMVALWNNSRAQIEKLNRETPAEVLWFLKPPSSFITHGQAILYPVGQAERIVLEGELGIVIGRACNGVSAEEAKECIFGYTVINDVTAQDVVKRDATFPQYDRGKGYDTFGVFGPVIETEVDPMTLRMKSYVNGELKQDFPVTDLVFNPYATVAEITKTMTLYPGDVIACGTTLNAAPITPGDTVEIRIDGIGSLVNPVKAFDRRTRVRPAKAPQEVLASNDPLVAPRKVASR